MKVRQLVWKMKGLTQTERKENIVYLIRGDQRAVTMYSGDLDYTNKHQYVVT